MTIRKASCSCGQLELTCAGEPVRVSICHCLACQQRTGSIFGVQARYPRGQVTIEGTSTEHVRTGDEGSRIEMHFCPKCGSTVYWQIGGMEEFIAVAVGAFANPGFPTPTFSVYGARRHAWAVMPELDVEEWIEHFGLSQVGLESMTMTLNELVGSRWEGKSELWEDPLGDVAQRCDCTIAIDDGGLTYTWSYKGKAHEGKLKLRADGAEFSDSWHQEKPIAGEVVPGTTSLATVKYTYMEEWGWRINLCHRDPTGELVLQMTNIAPWGEEARAVRMVCKRVGG